MLLNNTNTKLSQKEIFLSLTIIVFFLSLWILYILGINSHDISQYKIIWDLSKDKNFLEAYNNYRYEIGSYFLFWNLTQVFSPGMTFYLLGLIALSSKFYVIKKYCNYPLITYCIYTITFAHVLDGNQVRAALAATIVLYSFSLPHRSLFNYLILAIIASTFHYSGVIILIFYFIYAPFLGLTMLIVLSLIYQWLLMSLDYLSFLKYWLPESVGQVNLTSSIFIMQVCIAIVCAFYWKSLNYQQRKGAYLNVFGVIIYVAFIDNAIVAHRFRELSVLGILGVLFFGDKKLTNLKLLTYICFGYIVLYNIIYIFLRLSS